jgi:hypothetical protein
VNANPTQRDSDGTGGGDACDGDDDDDGMPDASDNCPTVANVPPTDSDGDRVGDACDNCPTVRNPLQGPAPGVKVGFCVDERLLFDERLAGLDRFLDKLGIGPRPWETFGHCIATCPVEVLREVDAGYRHAEKTLSRFGGGQLRVEDVCAFLLGMGAPRESVTQYIDRVLSGGAAGTRPPLK